MPPKLKSHWDSPLSDPTSLIAGYARHMTTTSMSLTSRLLRPSPLPRLLPPGQGRRGPLRPSCGAMRRPCRPSFAARPLRRPLLLPSPLATRIPFPALPGLVLPDVVGARGACAPAAPHAAVVPAVPCLRRPGLCAAPTAAPATAQPIRLAAPAPGWRDQGGVHSSHHHRRCGHVALLRVAAPHLLRRRERERGPDPAARWAPHGVGRGAVGRAQVVGHAGRTGSRTHARSQAIGGRVSLRGVWTIKGFCISGLRGLACWHTADGF